MPNDNAEFEQTNDSAPDSLRDTLSASFDAAAAAPTTFDAATGKEVDDGRARDEAGRFAPKPADALTAAAAPAQAVTDPAAAPAAPAPAPSLTTWRKEYLPLQEKLASGALLTPDEAKKLADYNVQREREYSTGISTYKAEAQQSRAIQDVMVEFMPALQQGNMNPAQWIQNMGRAHSTLVFGTPEQKMQMFANLARDYGIPLPAVAQAQAGQLDPTVAALMAEVNHLKQNIGSVTQYQQKQVDSAINQELAKFQDTAKYPHFEQARPMMIQLLESGLAGDLEAAYTKAVRMDDTLYQTEQQRQAAERANTDGAAKAAAAARARAASGQVKTGTPAGRSSAPAPSNDLRGSLESAFEQHAGGARV